MIDDISGRTMREKIMARRATAQIGLGLWVDAQETLRDASLADNVVRGHCD